MTSRDVTMEKWHGPGSLAGATSGLVLQAVPFLTGAWSLLWPLLALTPLAGLILLIFPGRVRQVGMGLVASCIAYPAVVAVVMLVAVVMG